MSDFKTRANAYGKEFRALEKKAPFRAVARVNTAIQQNDKLVEASDRRLYVGGPAGFAVGRAALAGAATSPALAPLATGGAGYALGTIAAVARHVHAGKRIRREGNAVLARVRASGAPLR